MSRAVLAIALALSAAACSSSGPPTVGDAPSAPERERIGDADVVVRGRLTVTGDAAAIAIKDNYFEPNILTGPPGIRVTLTIASAGLGSHTFSLTEQSIDLPVTPGQRVTATVAFPASGRLVFFCRFHRDESGMLGALDARIA